MKILNLSLIFTLLLAGSISFANRGEKQTLLQDFTRDLVYDRNCAGIQTVHKEMAKYQTLLSSPSSTAEQVNAKASEIQTWIGHVAKSKHPCRQSVLSLYLVSSVHLLTAYAPDIPQKWEDAKSARLPLSAGWAFYTVAALNQGVIQFTSDGNLNIVNHKHGKEHSILGSYNCQTLTVLLNPAQAPLNLGATLAHEMVHLFLDRFSTFNVYVDEAIKLTKYAVVMEESIASLHGAFLQREFYRGRLSPQLRDADLKDLTFFSHHGVVEDYISSWRDYPENDRSRFELLLLGGIFGEKENKEWIRGFPDPKTGRYSIRKHFRIADRIFQKEKLFNKVSAVYFGRDFNEVEQLGMLLPESKGLVEKKHYGPGYLRPRYWYPAVPFLVWWSRATESALYTMSRPHVPLFHHSFMLGGSMDFTPMSYDFEQWQAGDMSDTSQNRGISKVCRKFHELIRNGELQGYVGSDPTAEQNKNPEQEKNKSEPQDGKDSKPKGPAKPGGEGVRPGGEGVRPAGEGVRPAQNVRACIQHKL